MNQPNNIADANQTPQSAPDCNLPPVIKVTDPVNEPPLTPTESRIVDARQDDLMAKDSVAGLPPTHKTRAIEWTLVVIAALLLVIVAIAWALSRGASNSAIIAFSVAFALLLFLGGWPVLSTALNRGKEEKEARQKAIAELRHNSVPPTSPTQSTP